VDAIFCSVFVVHLKPEVHRLSSEERSTIS